MMKSKVLIVEDDSFTAEILKVTLENHGYEVTGMAASAGSFYRSLQTNMPDIVLMDIYLKGKKDGIVLAAETHEKYHLPVIFLTAFSEIELLERAKITEPFGYILKPFQGKELQSSIEMALYKHNAEKRIVHLNSILKTIRDVNFHISRVDNVPELIQKACDTLTSNRGYVSAWIALVHEDGSLKEFASSGLANNASRFLAALKQGFQPDCERCLNEGLATYQIRFAKDNCGDCPLREAYPGKDILTTKIRYKDENLGFLTVTTPVSLVENQEDIDLFTDISEDLGLAINNLVQLKKRERAEDALRQSEARYRTLVEMIPDGIVILNEDEMVFANTSASRLLNSSSPHELIGKSIVNFIHPDFREAMLQRIKKAFQEYTPAPFYDEVFIRIDGTIINVEVSVIPFTENDRRLMFVVFTDISARKKREQLMIENLALGEFALNHSIEELLALTIDRAEFLTGSQVGFFHFLEEDETKIALQSWSTNTLQLFCTAGEHDKHYPVDQAGVWADCIHLRHPVIHNDYTSLPHRKTLPPGHSKVIRELTVPVIRGDKVVAIMGVGNKSDDYDENDVEIVSQLTNLAWEYVVSKRFEEGLAKSEQYARALLNAIPDMIFRMNREGVYLDYKAAKEALHYQAASIVGRNNRELTPPDFADLVEEKIRLTLDQRSMEIFEYQLPIPEIGLRYYEARMVPSGPEEVTAISRDITERKKTDEALKKKIDQLEWFNRMMIDRELKMIELKKEINVLKNRLGEEDKYVVHQKPQAK